ncbi:Mothers against decapentaplegic [Schistosoma japonicum]|nr:Mothers against decapentaplegic [Schistosoma japonicum]
MNIVCLGLEHIINPIHDYAESHFEASNVNSDYPKDVLSLPSPSTLFSPVSSSSSSGGSTSSTETPIKPIYLDQSYDSVTSYDPMTNNLTTPLLDTKTKLGYCSSQVFHKLQQKLHISSDLSKLKSLPKTTQKSFEDVNHVTLASTTTTTMTSINSSDELYDFNSSLSTNKVNNKTLLNSNLYCNQHITMHNRSATVLNNEKNYPHTIRYSSSTPQHHLKPWANISYWELHHHVGRRWYHVTNRTLNIIYDDVDNEFGNNKSYLSSPKHVHSIHKVNHSSCRSRSQNDCKYLSLLTLYQSNNVKYNCKSDCNRINNESAVVISSNNNSSVIQSFSKRCRKCNHYINSFNTPSLLPNIIVHSSLHKSSFGWKQCYRLGNQGISLTLTTYGCVWLSNQAVATNLPIFVSSPCLQPNNDVNSSSSLNSSTDDFLMDRPVYRKGWGPTYRRPDVTHCPARLEVWINLEHLFLYSIHNK